MKSDILLLKESSREIIRVDLHQLKASEKDKNFSEWIKGNGMALRILGTQKVARMRMTYQYELDGATRYFTVPIEDDVILRWHLRHPLARCRKPQIIYLIKMAVKLKAPIKKE